MTVPSAATASENDVAIAAPRTAFEKRFRHPPGLFILFFTEMWERFSYYGMRGLLVLYMTKYLFFAHSTNVWGYAAIKHGLEFIYGPLGVQPLASQVYGLYTGLVYLTPIFGGMLADRLLGQRRTVIVGCLFMALGHFLMAFEPLFFLALFSLVLGNGFFKPNISTQVGALYAPDDARRDRAFSIFYMGINLGAFIANLICGTLAVYYGWHYGFAVAGVGMCAGLAIYMAGQKYLAVDNVTKRSRSANKEKPPPLTRQEWRRVMALVVLGALNIVFWAVYEQQGNTMQLWAEDKTVWPTVFGWQIPSPWFQSFNPALIIVLTPLLTWFWRRQSLKAKEPSSLVKMAMGCVILGLSFVIMVIGARVIGSGKGNLFWLLSCTFLLTIGELYISPIGMSLVARVSPPRIISMMMGVWLLSNFLGNYLSGLIGTFYDKMPKETFFLSLTGLGVAAGLMMWALNRPLRRALDANS